MSDPTPAGRPRIETRTRCVQQTLYESISRGHELTLETLANHTRWVPLGLMPCPPTRLGVVCP